MKAVLTIALATALFIQQAAAVESCTTPCSASQCKNVSCSLQVPYACTSGAAAGGCSPNPDAFVNTTTCTACCDASGCTKSCPPCNEAQCAVSNCRAKDPYLCTAGSAASGCAKSASTWGNNPACTQCCDTASCTGTLPPSSKCNNSCGDLCKNSKRCPHSTPYMCASGPATFGCSYNPASWNPPQCDSCCNVNLCPLKSCGACTPEQCKTTLCSATNPYICTAGFLKGGCSASSSYWPGSADCTACCDFNSC